MNGAAQRLRVADGQGLGEDAVPGPALDVHLVVGHDHRVGEQGLRRDVLGEQPLGAQTGFSAGCASEYSRSSSRRSATIGQARCASRR